MKIVLPVMDKETAELLLPIAAALLNENNGGEILLIGVVEVPPGRSLSEGASAAQKRRTEMQELLEEHGDLPLRASSLVRVSHAPWKEVLSDIVSEGADMLILPWSGEEHTPLLGSEQSEVLQTAPCDVVLVLRPERLKEVKRVLLPVRGGSPHSRLATKVAMAVARANHGEITVLHVIEDKEQCRWADSPFSEFMDMVKGVDLVTRQVTVVNDVVPGILGEIHNHEGIVIGVHGPEGDGGTRAGDVAVQVAAKTEATIFIVSKGRGRGKFAARRIHRPTPSAVEAPAPVSSVVDKWFAENTFHSTEFADLEALVELKQKQGVTISLGLPALNEEETIGNVIETVRGALQEKYPLLDEIVLIDSNSTDYTREIAESLGIPVYIHQEILPEHGSYTGKGEALWKSLYVLKGDIIVWIDTDIVNIHPRFVYGVLGPLLRCPRIKYVKGFYRRPLRVGDKIQAGGGGRVTELVARPMFNLFFPKLSGLIQPLSGEYAGRRELLERLPFFTGYGVETGLLIDILTSEGLWAIAQTDLLERIHKNKPLSSLSTMAFAIIQVFISRLEARHKIKLLQEFNKSMKLIQRDGKRYFLTEVDVVEHERPPMLEIEEYRRLRGIVDDVVDIGAARGD